MKKVMLCFIFLFSLSFHFVHANEENKIIEIQGRNISYNLFFQRLESIIEKQKVSNLYQKKDYILKIKKVLNLLKNDDINLILNNLLEKINNEIYTDENTLKEVVIWKSVLGKEIKVMYKWNITQWFTLFIWSIHGGYEYGTYESIKALAEKLKNSNKKQWMIIETLNPDGLQIFKENGNKQEAYLEWRWNFNGVDLNRNFCTLNYQSGSYVKNASNDKENTMGFSLWEQCGSEPEVQSMDYVLNNFKINKIIDIHSKWGIIFIPDNSIDDTRVQKLWYEVKKILGSNYQFDISYTTQQQKMRKIKIYEVDEGWSWLYTWMLITYAYEKFNIPSIIIELKEHWVIEENISKLVNMLD